MNLLSEEEYFYKLDNMVIISSQHLRTLFAARWKKESGMDWGQSETQGQEFIEGLGQVAYSRAMNAQKVIISKGCLDDWDISVLSLVLLNLGDWVSYKSENVAVRQLTTLRNELAHHPSKRLSLEEYNIKVDTFRLIMQGLGLNDGEIEDKIKQAGRISSIAALKSTKKLYDRASGLLKKSKFEAAIGCYDEAITMPGLLPIHQGTAYEKRAECYLKFAKFKKEKELKADVEDYCDQAIKDASRALEIKEKSWQAHFTMGQAYRLKGTLEKAEEHYKLSLVISPSEDAVKNELASCKGLLFIKYGATNHLNNLPMTLSEKIAKYSTEYGVTPTEEEFVETLGVPKEFAESVPGYKSFVRANQYLCGWGVRPNQIEALRYFTKSAEEGYTEGIYSLGICYQNGQGVAEDATKALELYLKAAEMSPESSGTTTLAGKNRGVAGAQESLGKMYEFGLVVEKDFVQAAMWFGKAAENGSSCAAYRLGLFYMNGWGVPRIEKLGELQWIQAVRFKEAQAAYSLVLHYKLHMEPEKAFNMFKAGQQLGHRALNGISEKEFMAELVLLTNKRNGAIQDLDKFESEHELDVKGMTIKERLQRMKKLVKGKPFTFSSDFPSNSRGKEWRPIFTDTEHIEKWEEGAKNGSPVAAGFLFALDSSSRVMDMTSANRIFKEEKSCELVNALYDIVTNEYKVHELPEDVEEIIKKPVAELFRSQHGKKGEMDMKGRLCFVEFNLKAFTPGNIARGIELIEEGLKMYPDNVNYYIKLCRLYGFREDFESGVTIAENGLEKFSDNLQLLYLKAILLKYKMANKEQVIVAFKQFLDKAPQDYPDVAAVCYTLASMYHFGQDDNGSSTTAKVYFKLGEMAEEMYPYSIQLQNRNVKNKLESVLGMPKADSDTKAQVEIVKVVAAHQQTLGVLQRKLYLDSPVRKRLKLSQRQLINEMIPLKGPIGWIAAYQGQRISNPTMIQRAPKRLSEVMPITMTEISPTKETIYENCSIELTIIEEPNIKLMWVQLVAEDENGEVVLVFIYAMQRTLDNFRRLAFGRRISVLNPYMQVRDLDTEMGIRVDDEDCLVYLGGGQNMCRFCGVGDAQFRCGKCKKARYCSKECQEHDWKLMKHKLICRHIKQSPL